MKPLAACAIALICNGYHPGSELLYLVFPEASMTNARRLREARFRSNSFSEKCRCFQSQAIQGSDVLISVAYLNQASAGSGFALRE